MEHKSRAQGMANVESILSPWEPEKLTSDLKQLMQVAIFIKKRFLMDNEKDIEINFTTLLLSFLYLDDDISNWFQQYVRKAGIEIDKIYTDNKCSRKEIEIEIQDFEYSNDLLIKPPSGSRSARVLFREARDIMQDTSIDQTTTILDVRHIMAAYIYGNLPNIHYPQLLGWKFDREKDWPNRFVSELNILYPQEIERWKLLHRTKRNTEVVIDRGLSAFISNDSSAMTDRLDYRIYAYAIARFLTHNDTEPPISISIQAPWGGGKTSLMKMVRNELDQDAWTREDIPEQKKRSKIIGSKITLGKLKAFLKDRSVYDNELRLPKQAFPRSGLEVKGCVTIWFNAWKYESTEQVWAGLADSIVRGIVDRMIDTPFEREWFLLQLNLHLEGADNVLRWITSQSLAYLWRKIRKWAWTSVITIGVSVTVLFLDWVVGLFGIIGSALLGGLPTIVKNNEVVNNPPNMSLGDYVKMPDYSKKLGYVHEAVEDLRILFNVIPRHYLPLVIFIDDLDRCSPNKVAQVVEGINLFLAGEFKNCIFVLGMDPEMVAASLEAEHEKVISKLPRYSNYTPIGWRFMDKFIQLPFVIPPRIESDIQKYIESLFITVDGIQSIESTSPDQPSNEYLYKEHLKKEFKFFQRFRFPKFSKGIADAMKSPDDVKVTKTSSTKNESVKYPPNQQKAILRVSRRIGFSSDQDYANRKQMLEEAIKFSNNPREIKRFTNMLRFQSFLLDAMLASNKPNKQNPPSAEQLLRWITLLLKWPAVVRWLYWGSGSPKSDPVGDRLKLLEQYGGEVKQIADKNNKHQEWQKRLEDRWLLNRESVFWLNDERLREFFEEESNKPETMRLSSSAGRGLY